MKIKRGLFLSIIILGLFATSCSEYNGVNYRALKRGNIKIFVSRNSNNKFIKNQIWSVSKFLKDKIPKQTGNYEVYIIDHDIKELLGDKTFSKHIFDRVFENPFYSDVQKDKAILPISADLDAIASDRYQGSLESLYFIPLADIIIIRNSNQPDKDHFLYGYLSLLLFEHNPEYYLNYATNEDDLTDLLLFRYLLTGFSSFQSRYFAKYPNRRESLALYKTIIKTDIKYLESNNPVDLELFRLKSVKQLVNEPESLRYYAHFFNYLSENMEEKEFLDLMDSFFRSENKGQDDLRDNWLRR
jgi:hypothetical protein